MFQVFFYSQGIFEDAKVPEEHIPFAIIGTNAVNVLMTVVAVRLCTLCITSWFMLHNYMFMAVF